MARDETPHWLIVMMLLCLAAWAVLVGTIVGAARRHRP